MSGYAAGIYLDADHCNISDNTASNNYYGIELSTSSNNTLTNNTASSNTRKGIYLSYSSNNTLTGNIMSNSYNLDVDGTRPSDYNNNIDTTNKVNGKPVYYWVNQQDLQIPGDAGYVGVINSSNITVKDLTLTNNAVGILFAYTNNSRIENVSTTNSIFGIKLYSSSNNELMDNIASNNENGIQLYYSSNNKLMNNTVNSNYWYGIYSCGNNNTITNNIANSNSNNGIELNHLYSWGNNNTITNNTVNSNDRYGILCRSRDNVLADNIASFNGAGINLEHSTNNAITGNTVNSNNWCGIELCSSSDNNRIYNNYFRNTINACDDGNNTWNITTKTNGTNIIGGPYICGNYWSDYAGEDLDGDGIGDTLLPYNSSGNIQYGGDWMPLVQVDVSIVSITPQIQQIPLGNTSTVNITINKVPDGLSGYNLTVSLSNASVAEILSVSPSSWASLNDNSTLPADVVWIKGVDLSDQVQSGATDINLGTLTLSGDSKGTTDIVIAVTKMDDDSGHPINPCTDAGCLTVGEVPTQPAHNPDTGKNFATIQAAIDDSATSDGHTIMVDAGAYTENVNVTKSLTIRSTSGNPADTTVQAANSGDPVFEVSVDCVNISGFAVMGATVGAGIYLGSGVDHCNISGNIVSNNDYGIFLESSSNNTIHDNYFNNTNNVYDGGNNIWNLTKTDGTNIMGGPYSGGNYWLDYHGEDTDGDGLGDTLLPYNSSGGIQNGGDWLPLVEHIPDIPDIGPWMETTALPQPVCTSWGAGRQLIAYNDHIYLFDGHNNTGGDKNYYSIINSDGSLGPWLETTPLPADYGEQVGVRVGNYMYLITGASGAVAVYYTPINPDGSLGEWNATAPLHPSRQNFAAVSYGEYIYVSGGNSGGTQDFVKFTSVNPDGSLNPWADTTPLPEVMQWHTMVANNGYLYVVATNSMVYYAPINSSDGTVGNWTVATPLPQPMNRYSTFAHNGHLYLLGGNAQAAYYAQIMADGSLGDWQATTSPSSAANGSMDWRAWQLRLCGRRI